MTQEFTNLNAFIDSFGELKNFYLDDQAYLDYGIKLNESCRLIREKLDERIDSLDTVEKLQIFVAQAQVKLTVFLDSVSVLLASCESENKQSRNCELLLKLGTGIMEILGKLRSDFPQYFDSNAKLPNWVTQHDTHIQDHKNFILHSLDGKAVDPHLTAIVEAFLDSFHKPGEFSFNTWREYDYFYEIKDELVRFSRRKSSPDGTLQLIKLLIGYNFNALEFYNYMLTFCEKLIDKDFSYEDQEHTLLDFLKFVEDIRQEHNGGYRCNVQPIYLSLTGSIRRQLDYISKQKSLYAPMETGNMPSLSSFYFYSALNLRELFFLYRIFFETGLARTKYKAQLYSFVKRYVKTEKTSDPSVQYMRNTFSSKGAPERKVVRVVRSWLMVMVSHIDNNYGKE